MADNDAAPNPPEPAGSASPSASAAPAPRRTPRHTWPQRAVLGVNSLIVLGCLVTAFALFYGNVRVGQRRVVVLDHPSTTLAPTTSPGSAPDPTDPGGGTTPAGDVTTTTEGDVWETPYEGDTTARNFLITGQSSEPCVDENDPTAGGFGAGNTESNLTDSIMVMRISPATNQAAVLSFPRDLWVKIHGRNGSSKINSAFSPTDPSRLALTLTDNFGIVIDHYININLCMFKTLVDALGGVKVPFEYAVYDRNIGLDIPEPGCRNLNGNEALAWVRTRKLWYIDPATGTAKQDPSSDWGRISRQQDFLRRLAAKAISVGLTRPRAATAFLDTYLGSDNIITDSELTVGTMLDFVSAMRAVDPDSIRTYQVETVSEPHNGLSTLGLRKNSDLNEQILAVFRGQAELATIATGAPDTSPGTDPGTGTASTGTAGVGTATTAVAPGTTVATTVPGATSASTLPVVDPEENLQGIVPPDDPSCR